MPTPGRRRCLLITRAGDLLVTADQIRSYLVYLGMPEGTCPYYLKKVGWPIGKTGGDSGNLIASKRKLARHTEKITTPAS